VKFLVKWTAENQFTEKSEALVKSTMLDIFALKFRLNCCRQGKR